MIVNKKYTINCSIEGHVNKATAKIKELFLSLDPKILELTDVVNYARGNYIGYKLTTGKSPFVEMHFRRRTNKIEIHLRPVNHFSSKLKIRKVPDSHLWKLNTVVDIYDNDDIWQALDLIKKSYNHILE